MRVESLNVGRPVVVVHDGRRYSTAFSRKSVTGAVQLGATGFVGDRVADSEVHGGPDKAACCYPFEHYDYWRQKLGTEMPVPSFGENLTTSGLLEESVCIGDVLRVGGAVVQISQPRQPCRNMADKHHEPRLPRWVNEVGYTGFYVRVLRPGPVCAGDEIAVTDRPHPGLTVGLATRALLSREPERDLLASMSRVVELSASWREQISARLRGTSE